MIPEKLAINTNRGHKNSIKSEKLGYIIYLLQQAGVCQKLLSQQNLRWKKNK